MKYLILILLIITSFIACDKIENPIPAKEGVVDVALCPEPTFPENTNTKTNILVEDFTGHKCNNCPGAAYTIDTLKHTIGSQIIPVAIHTVDFYAAPNTSGTKYTSDFRTSGGDDIKAFFAPSAGLPSVMVNRIDTFYSPNRYDIAVSKISSSIRKILNTPPVLNLQLNTSIDTNTGVICIYSESEVLQTISEDYSLVIMLTEDSIVDWQDYNGSGGDPKYTNGDIPDYEHKHVLRKSINGWQGETVLSSSAVVGDKVVKGHSFTITNSSWKKTHLGVVAFLYNNTTKVSVQAAFQELHP